MELNADAGVDLNDGAFGMSAGFGGWLRMDGPAALTVSMAVEMAICIGMLGMAVTVAAIIEAMYLEYSFV